MFKKSTEKLIPVKEFDVEKIHEAFREGRLFILPANLAPTEESIRKEGIRAILQYVSRIDGCASEKYLPNIHRLWEQILHSTELGHLFFLSRYNSNRNLPNWYRVNAVVTTLLNLNVYRKDLYTGVQLHLMMEQSEKRNNHYTGMNRYLLEKKEYSILKKML